MKKKHASFLPLAGICLLAFTAFMDTTLVDTSLPFIYKQLNTSLLQLQWLPNIYNIVLCTTMLAAGKSADFFGKKRIFYFGVFFFSLGALCAGFSPSIGYLIFFRAVQALGSSTIFVTGAALLSELFSTKERLKAVAIYIATTGLGLVIGPFLSGVLVTWGGWRWVFWIDLPLIVGGLSISLWGLKDVRNRTHAVTFDVSSLLLLMGGMGFLVYGIVKGGETYFRAQLPLFFSITGVILLLILIIRDLKRPHPFLLLALFRHPLMQLAGLSAALAGVVSCVFIFFDPLYLELVQQLAPIKMGLWIALIPMGQLLVSFVFKKAVERFGIRNLLLFSILSAFAAIILHRFLAFFPLFFLVLPFLLLGINWGIANAGIIVASNEAMPEKEIGNALGTLCTLWNGVGSLLLGVSTLAFHASEKTGSFLPAFYRMVEVNALFAFLFVLLSIVPFLRTRSYLP